jgi:hypothetical protein
MRYLLPLTFVLAFVLSACGQQPPDAPPADPVPRLIKDLRGPHDRPKVKAAERLGRMGKKAAPATAALCQAAGEDSEDVRTAALAALETVAPHLYEQAAALALDKEPRNQAAAARALAAMGRRASPASPLVLAHARKLLALPPAAPGSFDYRVEPPLAADIACLAVLAPEDSTARAVMARCLRHIPGYEVRPAAVAALRDVSKAHPSARNEVVAELLKAVDARLYGKPDVRTSVLAIKALADFGPDARAAIPALKKMKVSPTAEVRAAAAEAFRRIDRAPAGGQR